MPKRVLIVDPDVKAAQALWNGSDCSCYELLTVEPFWGITRAVAIIEAAQPDAVAIAFHLGNGATSPQLMQALRKKKVFQGVVIMYGLVPINLRESLDRSFQTQEQQRPSRDRGFSRGYGDDYSYGDFDRGQRSFEW